MLTQNILISNQEIFMEYDLCDWKKKNSYVLASETCALDIINSTF